MEIQSKEHHHKCTVMAFTYEDSLEGWGRTGNFRITYELKI
jgi:hypothetical protein